MQSQETRLSREERELINYYRGLPVHHQLDVLSTAESHFNAAERMKELSFREIERHSGDDRSDWH